MALPAQGPCHAASIGRKTIDKTGLTMSFESAAGVAPGPRSGLTRKVAAAPHDQIVTCF
jgi:hypothetical protein